MNSQNAGEMQAATASAVVPPTDRASVVLRAHGGWTRHVNAAGNGARTVWSREVGQSQGLCLNRVVGPGEDPPITESYDDRVEDRLLEGDECLLYLPFFFPLADGWSAPLGSETRFMALTNGNPDGERLKLLADHQRYRLVVNAPTGVPLIDVPKSWGSAGSGDRDQWLYFWLRMRVSSDSASGWLQWGRGIMQNGVAPADNSLMPRQTVALLHPKDGYLQLHAGQRNSAVLTGERRLIHCQITGWRKRAGESSFTRLRFDPDADVMRVGFQNEVADPAGINNPTYAETVSPATYSADRIRFVDSFNGRSAVRHTVKENDLASNGARSDLSLTRRPIIKDNASPDSRLMQFTEGDLTCVKWGTWFPDEQEFPIDIDKKWWLTTQFHQLAESGASPPHSFAGQRPSPLRWEYLWGQNKAETSSGTGLNTLLGQPPARLAWQDFEWWTLHSSDATKGWVTLIKDGATLLDQVHRQTLFDPDGSTLSSGEVVGKDIPEFNFLSTCLYQERSSKGGYSTARSLYHSNFSVTVWRAPNGTRVVDAPLL